MAVSILTSNDTMSWWDAVEFCAKEKKILRKGRPDLNEDVSERFWTRIYKKEHFVYLIGCFKPSQIKTYTPTNMTDEECLTCLNHHPFMFAKYMNAENHWCSCVYETFPDPPNQCDFSEHVFVFGANDGYQKRKHGVQLKCINNKPILIQKEHHKKRNFFCNNTVLPGKFTWQKAIERCKKASGTLGKLKFDDFCKTTDIKAWFGFGTVTTEEEYMKHSDLLEPKRCQSCVKVCQFENCSEHRKPNCESETKPTSVNVLNTTSMRPLYTATATTSGVRTQYVPPHKTRTGGSQHTTVITSQQTTRLLSKRSTIYSVSKKSKSTSVNVLYTTSMRPLYTVTTSGRRTQDVTPHQITTSGSQQTTVITSQQTTRLLSQRTTIYSVSITNQTKNNVGDNVNVTGDTNVNIKMVLIYTASPLLAAILIVLCVLYTRSKRKRRRKVDLTRQPVREQLYELADNSQLENMVNDQDRADGGLCAGDPVTPGSGQREDIYNHLRERSVDPSQEGEEGVYSRCVGGDDNNDTYDVTFRNKLQFPTRDSVYNHVILFDSSTR
uniref:Uncharacterized protein LOC111121743 isoform X4 n=1 Tax=Crassostrea virginica TaxID=6565 RepID=A0A8B8CSP9_CRAVI|nr:uncharacterized protein LOC111121743 isoform X4 [Crassostrea virginica]